MPVLPLNAVIGKYRIERLIGAGGMGEGYRATNLQGKTPVAVKALTHTGESGTALARFRNEAVIQYNLRHPNVAELYEYFDYQGIPCIVMEFVEGRTLADVIRETGGLEVGKALDIIADICDAVSYMHAKGTIHRDIKSENIRVNVQGQVKLLDFGIAVDKYTPAFTRQGSSIGTPGKMAPEQHQGLRGDARSDVWALGVLLYELVTGVLPFSSASETGLRQDVLAVRYVPPQKRRPGLPKALVRIISTCLRLKPEERYASSGVMLREVQQLRRRLNGQPRGQIRAVNPAYVAAGLALLVLGLLVYAISSTTKTKDSTGDSKGLPQAGSVAPTSSVSTADKTSPPAKESSGGPPRRAPAVAANPSATATPGPGEGTPVVRSEPSPEDQTTIKVTTYDGTANVYSREGRYLGQTPWLVTGPAGQTYEYWLRRDGYQPLKVAVQINVNKKEYLFGLEKN